MRIKLPLLLSLIVMWLFALTTMDVFGQKTNAPVFPNLKFSQINIKDGLSTNAVRCTYEDKNGIIWIATSKGLNRYDGASIKEFIHNPNDSTSICNNVVTYIVADTDGYLWLSTFGGLARFNPNTGKAKNFFHQEGNKNSLSGTWKCIPYLDSKGRLWLATDAGIQLFDYKTNTFTTYNAPEINKPDPKPAYNSFNLVREDEKKRLWALSAYGLYLIDEQNRNLKLYKQPTFNENIAFYQSKNGTIYLGQAEGGLKSFDPKLNTYQSIYQTLFQMPYLRVNDITEWSDNQQNNWLCIAAGGGFALMDIKTNQLKTYVSNNLNPTSLNAFSVFHITKDRQNRLWLSTDNGISIIDPNLQNFDNIPLYQQLNLNNPKLFGLPNNMLETDDYFYVTGYYGKGFYVFDKKWKLVKHVLQIPQNSKSALSKSINSIYKDNSNNLWFSTDSGLVKQHHGGYEIYLPPIDLTIKENLGVSKLYKRSDGLFWIRARQNGLYLFDPIKGRFIKQYKPDGINIDGPVYSGFMDKQNNLWAGTTKGISRYNPSNDAFSKIKILNKKGKESAIGWITDITEDNENVIWAVSDAGLLKIDKTKGIGLLIDHNDGLPENYLKRISIDTLGNLWIPSQQGIIKYDRKKSFIYFNINNGLPFQYEGHGFFEKDKQNNLLLSFSGFVTRFDPYHIKTNTDIPRAIFMDISIDGEETILQNINNEKKLIVPPGAKIINIQFALTNYTAAQENSYFYKIGKATKHWQQVENGNIALGIMPKGEYELYVKGSNNDDVFSKEEKLLIKVLPHWYETNLFIILCLLSIAVIIFILLKRRINFVRNQFLFKQKLSESELKAMRAQMNPHFIFNVLNSIEAYIMDNEKVIASRLIQKFASLSRLILENSTKNLVTADKEWKALVLYTELEAMRYSNSFSYEFIVAEQLQLKTLLLPPMLIQPIIENAILHGLIVENKSGAHLEVKLQTTNTTVCITVSDNGVGIGNSASTSKKIGGIKEKSMGIASVKERIEMINLQYQTTSAKISISEGDNSRGTVVIIYLPRLFSS
ncbi:two-component regulator propeller domain-containing protein [Pedobacter foliorum]|uniref:ligand-binding sensor domain-containing protein n=1 Tax=Pedobacter foliorum TaxID=2739058 RepID=UPI0015647410|nr:two-component regulator propeller domain-containing protein [Pedobacter foliorum]NRF39481.1 histidine kinase [Pedobacter foliorum]